MKLKWQTCWQRIVHLNIQQAQSNKWIDLEVASSPIFTLLLALICSPPTSEENICLFSCQMLLCDHQLVTNCACQLLPGLSELSGLNAEANVRTSQLGKYLGP